MSTVGGNWMARPPATASLEEKATRFSRVELSSFTFPLQHMRTRPHVAHNAVLQEDSAERMQFEPQRNVHCHLLLAGTVSTVGAFIVSSPPHRSAISGVSTSPMFCFCWGMSCTVGEVAHMVGIWMCCL